MPKRSARDWIRSPTGARVVMTVNAIAGPPQLPGGPNASTFSWERGMGRGEGVENLGHPFQMSMAKLRLKAVNRLLKV